MTNGFSPKLSTAAITGITVGAILFLALRAGFLFFLTRKVCAGRQTAARVHTQNDSKDKTAINNIVELATQESKI